MREAQVDWQAKYEELRQWCNGCETYQNAEIDHEGLDVGKWFISIYDPIKFDNWGNRKWVWGGEVQDFAWMMLTGKYEVELPYYILNEELPKYRFFEKARIALEVMKKRGAGVGEMFAKHGCPCCGTKEGLEWDGESEGDGCSADWAVWCHWSAICTNKECDGWGVHGSFVESSGGR